MSRFFVGLALWALLFALAACGGDGKITDPARDTELAEMVDTVASNFDNLPSCTRNHEGVTAYVEDEEKAYVCDGDDWTVDGSLTNAIQSDSEKKSSSSAKAKSSSNEKSDSSSKAKSSSSRDGKSNSSDEEISSSNSVDSTNRSSSSAVPLGCKIDTEDNCEYGSLTDDRDGLTYKTVKIGEQWWMAENLNYAYTDVPFKYSDNTSDSTSWCYDNDAANCAKYGRLYTWAAAMDSVGTWSTNGMGCGYNIKCSPTDPVRGICPEGWHLPDITEWNALFTVVGERKTAETMLKSMVGWWSEPKFPGMDYTNGNGTDAYSFSALPAGYRYGSGYYTLESYGACFWSSSEGNYNAYCMCLFYDSDGGAYLGNDNIYQNYGASVRCLKDYGLNKYGTLTDNRDGRTYKTVKIGEQWWMAENLNYETKTSSYCRDSAEYCEKYGRLYTWATAVGKSEEECGWEKNCDLGNDKVQGVCPDGWHLPDTTEWNALFTAVGGKETAGTMLKSTEGWENRGNGPDAYSFSALPAGFWRGNGVYDNEGNDSYFWSSTEGDSSYAFNMSLYYDDDNAYLYGLNKYLGLSVRCLKD